jgi:hypothetical protein
MPANRLSAVPGDSEIDGAANLDQLRQIASTLMSALLLGTVTPKEGSKGKPALARRHRVGECCAAGFSPRIVGTFDFAHTQRTKGMAGLDACRAARHHRDE